MKVIGIKTNKGYYICSDLENKSWNYNNLEKLIINGCPPEKTFHSKWVFVKDEPKTIQEEKSQPNINHRYELIDKTLSDRFKDTYLKSEVEIFDDEGDISYIEEFKTIRSLYELKSDPQPKILVDVEFEYQTIQEIEEIKDPAFFSYKRIGDYDKIINPIGNGNVKYDMISQIITPEILLHTQPCKLTSKETYDIVRAYIKDNINPKVAEISSDYAFCFQVNKKVTLAKEHVYQVDVNSSIFSGRKRKPKYETRVQKTSKVKVFEMTYSPENYQGYTPIKPFEADNSDDLKEYIDNYLKHLISVINEPLDECPTCSGRGVLLSK